MKRTATCYFILLILVLQTSGLRSQDLLTGQGERIQVCTDRTLYISGEKIFFTAIIFNEKHHFADEFSRIYYCELIRPDGSRVSGGKYLLHNRSGSGCLTIPEETITGIYYLKFYTRFMRDASQDEYKYIMVKIINPARTEVLPGNENDTKIYLAPDPAADTNDLSMKIQPARQSFSSRDEISLRINVNSGSGIPPKLCLSVIPESTAPLSFFTGKQKTTPGGNGFYFPETRGISLSGQLVGKDSGKPIPGAKVNLSIIGDKDLMVIHSDSNGKFFFALPGYYGNRDVFLSSDELPGLNPEILIDNDYCSRPVHLPSPLFIMSEDEMKTAYKLAVNSRITSIFRQSTAKRDSSDEEVRVSFYGKPSEVLVMDKYIELPTLGEYFTELPGMLKLRKIQGKRHFRFYTEEPDMMLYDPLVLIDWVAVDDIEKILAMSPQKIERVELVNAPYIKGSITYGGIVSFVSKKKDFAGIHLPTSGTFVNYGFLDECNDMSQPVPTSPNSPDSRNTVYWNPDLPLNNDGSAMITFTAPDTPGNYIILLRKITVTGEVSSEKIMVTVR